MGTNGEYEGYFWDDRNILPALCFMVMLPQHGKFTKNHWLSTWNRWIVWYAKYTSVKSEEVVWGGEGGGVEERRRRERRDRDKDRDRMRIGLHGARLCGSEIASLTSLCLSFLSVKLGKITINYPQSSVGKIVIICKQCLTQSLDHKESSTNISRNNNYYYYWW